MIISKNGWQLVIQLILISLCLTNLNVVRSECSDDQWECDNGQCIAEDDLCDGKVNCNDRSDETAENCIQFHENCPRFAFRCAYGACIFGKAGCNGVQDCADNSDELMCVKKDDSDFQGTCSEFEIQCLKSKECINSVLLCDGVVNCKDGSDESLEVCINYGCTSFGFQCGNGACIAGKSKCNGIKECADGSDEAWGLCKTPRNSSINVIPTPTPSPDPISPTPTSVPIPLPQSCFIPNLLPLQNLRFKLHPANQTIELDSYVEAFDVIHIECKNKYTLRGQSSLLCKNGTWDHNFPTCDGYCDGKALSTLSLRAICYTRSKYTVCPEKIVPGTLIQVRCAFGYSRGQETGQELRCLSDGSFNKKPERCSMKCGKVASDSTTLSKNGIEIDVSKAPWHVAIFEDTSVTYIYKCGGSIISPTVVISAAHCFWDEANSIPNNYTNYQVIAGRSTSNYSTEQTEYSQLVKVQEIHLPIEYQGKLGRQMEDIAFLKLETSLRFSETIAPICVPEDLRYTGSRVIESGKDGLINGFGMSNKLERLKMKTLNFRDCLEKSPDDAPVAEDKFCIYNTDGGFVCRGDSGGGFYLENKDHDTGEVIYRLWGVISNTPTTRNDCTRTGDKAYVAITNIFIAPASFKRKLLNARKEDELLF